MSDVMIVIFALLGAALLMGVIIIKSNIARKRGKVVRGKGGRVGETWQSRKDETKDE